MTYMDEAGTTQGWHGSSGATEHRVRRLGATTRALAEARTDPDFVLIARTDAIATEGLDAAIERAHAHAEAGADVIFVEAPEMRQTSARKLFGQAADHCPPRSTPEVVRRAATSGAPPSTNAREFTPASRVTSFPAPGPYPHPSAASALASSPTSPASPFLCHT
ncbi:hypothetical protein GCM10010298_48200 [Streptomyces microflavus]|uniref:Uncharacterized protein n=2 Tax=Streptomyces TaxID=1883 RepID=A0A7J0CHM0_STRMI|nr:hypothetical protein Smic_05120 [Streptomyces microflavus]GGX77308.1 hypothetical protein GCM10010298_48200 [Streptomyces microflavus]